MISFVTGTYQGDIYVAGGLVILGLMILASCFIYVLRWLHRRKPPKGW